MATHKTTVAQRQKPGPKPGAKAAAREALIKQFMAKYDAASTGRRMRGWAPPSSGPNRALEGLQNIRNRSRDLERNTWAGKSASQRWTTTLIGTGIVARLPRKMAKDRKAAIGEAWKDWTKVCDADGVLDFYGLQSLAARTWIGSGECFARLRYRRANSGMQIPMQVQLIEPEQLPLLDTDTWPGMRPGNRIRGGIEIDRSSQRVAYWFYREHPFDNKASTINATDLIRVSADEVIHLYEPPRIGAMRGVPDIAPIITRLRNIDDFDDAVLERQKIANLFAAFIKKAPSNLFDPTIDPLTGKPIVTDSSEVPMVGLEPGTTQELGEGEEMQFSNPPEAGTTYSDYMRTQQLGTAAGAGIPYELFSGDIKDISDRTLRVLINEFRRYAMSRQWQHIIPQMLQKIRDAWVGQAVLSGVVMLTEVRDAKSVTWAPDGWEYIHPVQDVQAKQLEVEMGFRSRSDVIAERGDDPEEVDEERAADKEREDDLGLTPEPIVDPLAAGGAPNDPNQKPQNRALDNLTLSVARLESAFVARASEPKDTSAIEHFIAGLTTVQNSIAQVASSVAALAAKPTEIKVTNEVNPTPIEVTNNLPELVVNNALPPTTVNVQNTVPQPTVEITNNVPPAEVTVNLPARKTESDITRDRDGNIVNVVQTETTLQ